MTYWWKQIKINEFVCTIIFNLLNNNNTVSVM